MHIRLTLTPFSLFILPPSQIVQVLCASADAANGHLLPSTNTTTAAAANNSSNNATRQGLDKAQGQGQGQGGAGWRGRVGSGAGNALPPSRTVAFQR